MKQLIWVNIGSYAFDKTAKTVTISGITDTIRLEWLYAIVNTNTNTIIYQPNKVGKGATLAWYVFTLDYDTSAMTNTDELMIIMDLPESSNVASTAVTSPNAEYKSPFDFTAVFTSGTTITLSVLPISITDNSQISYIKVVPASWESKIWQNGINCTLRISGSVVTIYNYTGTPFVTWDVYEVGINGAMKAFELNLNALLALIQNPDASYYQPVDLAGTTNVPAATNYYPSATGMSIDSFKNQSLTFDMIDADGTMTLTVEVNNDQALLSSNPIQIYMFDDKANAKANSRAVTNGTLSGAISFTDFNYQFFRIKMVNSGATNTFNLKWRQVY